MPAYDVAVIGLGAMGSAALFHLARRGLRVIGIEQFEPGHDRGSSHGESRIIRLAYFEHPSYVPLVRRAFENWRDLERLTGQSVLTMTGILEAGMPGSAIVAGVREACRVHGLDHQELTAGQIARRFPAFDLPSDYTGIWQPEAGFLSPERANSLHLALARDHGADLAVRSRVAGIERQADGLSLQLGDTRIQAATVIVSAGAWAAELLPELAPHLTLLRQVLCWYDPKIPRNFALGAFPVFLLESPEDVIYGFPDFAGTGFKCASHHGRTILPRANDARQDAGPADEARTRHMLERYLPSAAGPLKAMKTCIYTMTPDEDFILDRLPADPRIIVASPCSGHGFKFASMIGETLAEMAAGRELALDISRFRLSRFGV